MNTNHINRFSYARYTATAFPAYAFVPGQNAHPSADPAGHNAGQVPCASLALTENNWMEVNDYLFGCDLYNHGFWWEAHEAWEKVWLAGPSGDKTDFYLRALIQAANGLLKLRMQRAKAADRLSNAVGELLAEAEITQAKYMGLNIAPWLAEYETYVRSRGEQETVPLLCLTPTPSSVKFTLTYSAPNPTGCCC